MENSYKKIKKIDNIIAIGLKIRNCFNTGNLKNQNQICELL